MSKNTSLELAPPNGAMPLSSMTVPQLTTAYRSLHECQGRYDKLSGICAIMKGMVLAEVKHKSGHGNFLPWLKDNFPKSRQIAAQDMRLAAEFFKSKPKFTFEALGRDLLTTLKELEEAQLDLKHPLVREVASFVGERTRYQLLLDFPGDAGSYDRSTRGKGKSSKSEREQAEEELLPPLDLFVKRWRRGAWIHLPHSILSHIAGDLLDIRTQIKKAVKK